MNAIWALTLKATCLLLFGFAGSFALRRASAASRAALWQATAAALVAMAALSWVPVPSGVAAMPAAFRFDATAIPGGGAAAGLPWLKIIWLAGVAFVILRMAAGHGVMAWIVRRSPERIIAPVTWGLLRPEVLMPFGASNWSEDARRAVLLHEAEHVRRRDPLWQFAWQMICAVLWFHPLTWLAYARFRNEAEQACDDAVLSAGVAAPDYAEVLLKFVAADQPSPVALGMQGHADFAGRMRAILNPTRRRGKATLPAICLALATVLLAVPLAAIPAQESKKAAAPQLNDDVTKPKLLQKTNPKYTADAKEAKVEGTVLLLVVIDEQGHAKVQEILKPLYPSLDASAVESVETWIFQPATKAGKPVAAKSKIEINFKYQ